MADSDVNIVGVNGGAPDWATEHTLEAMLDKIEALVDVTKKQRADIKQAVKSKSDSGGSSDKEQKKAENLLGKLSEGFKDVTGKATDAAAGFDNLPGPLAKFTKGLKKTNVATYAMLAGFGLMANQATKAVISIGDQVSTLRDLADSGIQLEGSFMEMSRGLAEVGMTVQQFGEISSKYARVMSMQGFKALSELSSAVNETTGGFAKWGMTQAEGIEIAAELIDQQRRSGIFRDIENQREGKRIEEVMNRLTAYSKVLNVSRETMLEGQKAMLSEADVRFRLSQMTEEERVNFEKGIGGTAAALTAAGEDYVWIADLMREAAVNQINEQSEAWQSLAAAGFTPLANKLAEMADVAAATGKELTMEEVTETMREFGQNNKDFLESMFIAGGASKDYAIKIANASLTAEEAEDMRRRLAEKGANMEKDAVDENVQIMTGFQQKINEVIAAAEHLRVDGFMTLLGVSAKGGLTAATAALDVLSDKMLEFSDGPHLENFRDFIVENPWKAAGVAIVGMIAVAGTWSLVTAGVTAAIAALGPALAVVAPVIGTVAAAGATFLAVYKGMDWLLNDIGSLSTGIGDLVDKAMGRNQDINGSTPIDPKTGLVTKEHFDSLSPDQQQVVLKARERRAENNRKRAAEKASSATTSQSTNPTTEVTPSMSESDLAKLSVADRQAYLLGEILRVNKKLARNMSGDVFAQ